MTRFGFIIHPLTPKDAARKYPIARFAPDWLLEQALVRMKPVVVSRVTGVRSKTGVTTEGVFVGCPLTPKQMTSLPLEIVYDRIVESVELAAKEGAQIVGLGAFTSVVGDGGVTIAERCSVPITTGNSYTVATAIDGLLYACDRVGIDRKSSTLAVMGATGSIGRTCTICLAPEFGRTIAVGRDEQRTRTLAEELGVEWSTDAAILKEADAVITVTSSESEIVQPEHLKPGSVVCDVARPRDVSVRVARERPDVLVIEGGVVRVPGQPDFAMDFGFPTGTAYACMSETMILALEDRPESYTLGKTVSAEQVNEMRELASLHGFEIDGLRSFERALDEPTIERVRKARQTPATA